MYKLVLFFSCEKFGPLSERFEVTTGPGAPEQCKAPSTTCKSSSCVVVSWEVRLAAPTNVFKIECRMHHPHSFLVWDLGPSL